MLKISTTSFEKFKKLMDIKPEPGETEKSLWKRVERYIPPLKFIPGVRMIGVGNSLSMNACHRDSDIDLFIVTRRNRIWTVRILVTLYFSVLGLRKTSNKHAGKFCLSFFITEDALDFQSIAVENDIYLYFWILHMKPIINIDTTYGDFIQQNTSWCDFSDYQDMLIKNTDSLEVQQKSHNFPQIFSHIWDLVESSLKYMFLPRTKKSFQNLGKPFGVIVSDDMLKFHDKDRREKIKQKSFL